MPTIRALPSSVVNKIAAGEVIERPASVVKELLENAVDAGATRVDVAIERGGVDLIRISDNGCGIAADELPLAVTNHATSKIASADDLFRVGTLGFRGEALASIAEVSRFVMRSRTADAASGAELRVHGGVAEGVAPAGCPVGTTIEVRDLFYNVPVRQKFLRTPGTEIGHITEAMSRIALAAPQTHFTLSHNGRVVHDLPGLPTSELPHWRERIGRLFGDEIAAALVPVESENQGVRLAGFVAGPHESRSNNRLQYLLLNGRAIRDRSLQHALGEAYRGLLLTGRYPICFLRLDMPPELVDVNVHPTKLEVRFQDGGRLYSQLLGTIRTKFLSTDLKAPGTDGGDLPAAGGFRPFPQLGGSAGPGAGAPEADASELVNWAKRELSQQRFDQPAEPRPMPPGEPLVLHRFRNQPPEGAAPHGPDGTSDSGPAAPMDGQIDGRIDGRIDAAHNQPTGAPHVGAAKAIQLHNRYLIVESQAGMEVIDQHALHERILYEQLRAKVLGGALETQRLLVPEPVDFTPAEAAAALENRALLAQLGVAVDPFGGDTVLVSSYPAMLANLPPAEVLRDLVERLISGGRAPDARDLLDELLHTISCKAAVKYGDRLSAEEVDALLAHRHLTENHHHCPHGRPTALVFTCDDLDRRFQRI
ncbi:DNA mismatch repair protein MutL [Pirellulimonas nuda]|uniref:DNA mismatch repair protein MutL n=1 Tax=Pirellulimonas nuda TaxID=2528009 RepID=A0A518D9C5_9BACT|nr:DNA mismatch repair endonuclease MutL [Pirellulimonas nuda]QDU88074.1 DNA mismatch repair protein MutL [Pirellulimonas nuda]